MDLPVFATDDPASNRKVWADWLRRPDWNNVPTREDGAQECRTPWDVGLALAFECWPSSEEVIDSDEYEYQDDVDDAIMIGCYGVCADGGAIDPADLPDRVRSRIMMAARAAQSAPPYANAFHDIDKNSVADLINEEEWNLVIIGGSLIGMWEHNQSPMSGAIMTPQDVARLIADILDAAPPSLLVPPEGQ